MGDSADEIRELLVGTWTGIAVLAEVFIDAGFVAREEILETMSAAEAVARDRRDVALRGIRVFIERLGNTDQLLRSK